MHVPNPSMPAYEMASGVLRFAPSFGFAGVLGFSPTLSEVNGVVRFAPSFAMFQTGVFGFAPTLVSFSSQVFIEALPSFFVGFRGVFEEGPQTSFSL